MNPENDIIPAVQNQSEEGLPQRNFPPSFQKGIHCGIKEKGVHAPLNSLFSCARGKNSS